MNARILINGILGLGCVAAIFGIVNQHQQLTQLRTEANGVKNPSASEPSPVAAAPDSASSNEEELELMRLRNEAAQLRRRKNELAKVRKENQDLRATQTANQANSTSSGVPVPSGFIRQADAQFLGFHSPEAALQSAIWAIAHRDTNVLFRAMEGFQQQFERAQDTETFWKDSSTIPGFRVIQTDTLSDTEARLKIEIAPGLEQPIIARKIGSDWKIMLR